MAFYRDTLGFEVRNDVGYEGCAGSTTSRPTRTTSSSSCVRRPPNPGITDEERRTIAEMMAKGTYGGINFATHGLDETFAPLPAGDTEVVEEPTNQPYRVATAPSAIPPAT